MDRVGPAARVLGYAGLLPQVAVVVMLLSGDLAARYVALALGFAYAALILSFLGGIWWGLAAADPGRAPRWLWVAAVVPSLVALASAWPWMVGLTWPGPSLVALGLAILATLAVDRALLQRGLESTSLWRLRLSLSLGLGGLTLLTAAL